MKILVINGPNLNMLGIRQPEIYGNKNYKNLISLIKNHCKAKKIKAKFFQSNHEGKIIDKIQNAYGKFDGIVINPGGLTHTSVCLLDALSSVGIPAAEVHISDVNSREDFRKISFIRQYCKITVSGKGFEGYLEAIDFLAGYRV